MNVKSNLGRPTKFANLPVFAGLGLLQLLSGSSLANPAVSSLSGKLGASYGRFDVTMDDVTSVDGSIAWPLADAWGLQLDGMYAHGTPATFGFSHPESVDYGGFGGHVFWRDPSRALVGLESAYVFSDSDDVTAYQIGFESEYYLSWITLGLQAGYSEVDDDQMQAGDNGFYARLTAGCYPVNNLLINSILETRYDNLSYGIELEYQTPLSGLSVFASAMNGEHDDDSVFAGMRYYFGGESNLKSRHRNSDPPSRLPGLFAGIRSFQADLIENASINYTDSSNYTGGSSYSGGSLNTNMGGVGQVGSGTLTLGGTLGPGSSPILDTRGTLVLQAGGGIRDNLPLGVTLGGTLTLGGSTIVGGATGIFTGSTMVSNGNILTFPGIQGTLFSVGSSANSSVSGSLSRTDPQAAIIWLESGTSRP